MTARALLLVALVSVLVVFSSAAEVEVTARDTLRLSRAQAARSWLLTHARALRARFPAISFYGVGVNEQDDTSVHVGIGFPTVEHVRAFEGARQLDDGALSFLEVDSADSTTAFEVKALHWPLEHMSEEQFAAAHRYPSFVEQKAAASASVRDRSRSSVAGRLQAKIPSQVANAQDGWAYGIQYAQDGGLRFGSIIMKCGDNDRNTNTAGSVAGLLRDKVGGKYYAVTAGHVMRGMGPPNEDDPDEPGPMWPTQELKDVCTIKDTAHPAPKPFAQTKPAWFLRDYNYDVGGMQLNDAEVATMKCEWPAAANAHAQEQVKVKGAVTGQPIDYLGREVMKVGPTSGVTFGKIWWLGIDIEDDYAEVANALLLKRRIPARGKERNEFFAARTAEIRDQLPEGDKWQAEWRAQAEPIPNIANMWHAGKPTRNQGQVEMYPDNLNRFAGGQVGYDIIKHEYRSMEGAKPRYEMYLIRELNKPIPQNRVRGDTRHDYWGGLDEDPKFSGPGDSGSAILLKDTKQVVAFLQGGVLARDVGDVPKLSRKQTAAMTTSALFAAPTMKVPQFSYGVPAPRELAKLNQLTGLNLEFCKEHEGAILWGDEQPKPKPKLKRSPSTPDVKKDKPKLQRSPSAGAILSTKR